MKLIRLIILNLCLLFFTTSAFAITLDEAKSNGIVGEQQNGYLGIVNSSNPEAKALVAEINVQRKSKYFEIANKNGTSMAAVEALAGKKAIEETGTGRFVQSASGQWGKK